MMGQDKEKKAEEAQAWTTYMVFEAQGDYQAAPDAHYRAMGVLPPRLTEPERLVPYACLGVVRAKTEDDAAKAVMATTRRIGKYSLVPVSVIDFAVGLREESPDRPQLNP